MKYEKIYKKQPSILCLGLSYKENSDDLRESPAHKIYNMLKDKGFTVLGVEPNLITPNSEEYDIYDLIKKYDIIVKLVNHGKISNINKEIIPKNKIYIEF